eukprot:gene6763-9265_t
MSLLKLYAASLVVSLISALSISYNWFFLLKLDFICANSSRVPFLMIQCCEWLVLIPFLPYLICVVEKKNLDKYDYFAILSSMMMILFGFLSIISGSIGLSELTYVFFALSFIFFVIEVKYLCRDNIHDDDRSNELPSNLMMVADIKTMIGVNKKQRLFFCACFFSIFPLVFILNWFEILSKDKTVCAYMIASALVKIGFFCVITQSHIHLSTDIANFTSQAKTDIIEQQVKLNAQKDIELKGLNEYRNVIGNTAHDLKTPLAGFSGAVDLIELELTEALKLVDKFCTNRQKSKLSDSDDEVLYNLKRHFSSIKDSIINFEKSRFAANITSHTSVKPSPNLASMSSVDSAINLKREDTLNKKDKSLNEKDNSHIFEVNTSYRSGDTDIDDMKSIDAEELIEHAQEIGNVNKIGGLSVLLVDDSDMIRKIVTKKLTIAGYRVDTAENGSVAVNKVDIINGESKKISKSLIIGCSANVGSIDLKHESYHGIDYMLEKPFNIEHFIQISESLKSSQQNE